MASRNAISASIGFETLASVYPSTAKKSNETLPCVTIDGFETMAAGFRYISKAAFIHYSPLLKTMAELKQWNHYSVTNRHWIAEGRRHKQGMAQCNLSEVFPPFVFVPGANFTANPANGSGPFCPIWQMSPVPDTTMFINFDTFSYADTRSSMEHAAATGEPSLTKPMPHLRRLFVVDFDGPMSLLHTAVYNDTVDTSAREVVGFLVGAMGWVTFFDNVLPTGQDNILVVVESCSSTNSTFLINGPVATFLGDSDLHDSKYNDMALSQYFVGSESEDTSTTYKRCRHVVHVFPTRQLENEYVTKAPMHCALFVVLIFAFSAFVFFLYD
jgi:CHASE domain